MRKVCVDDYKPFEIIVISRITVVATFGPDIAQKRHVLWDLCRSGQVDLC